MAPVRGDRRWRGTTLTLVALLVAAGADATMSRPADSRGRLTAASGSSPEPVSTSTSSTTSTTDAATINRCRERCLAKHSVPDTACNQTRACSTCWSSCATPGAPSRQLIPLPTRCQLELTVQRMVRNESLVTADVSWTTGPSTASNGCSGSLAGMPISASQCLVTWEVSGGGLMGNLLTESTSVQLSLWPDTSYRVQVTCRSKHSSALVRSAPLLIGTSGAIVLEARKSTTTTTTTTPLQILLAEIAEGDDDEALARALDSSEEAQDTDRKRQRTPAQSSTTAKLHPWPIARESESEIAILALFVAMLLFLLVLLTIVILVRWQPGPGEPERLEKDALVANEVMVEILHV